MDAIGMALCVRDAVAAFADRARRFYYAVMLMGHACPGCGGPVDMIQEGVCRCRACGHELDPTATFQRCSECGGQPVLRVRRYKCKQCGRDVPSRFLFNGLIFNTGYFRQKMAESRRRKAERLEAVRRMLAETRSLPLRQTDPIDLESVPGLKTALDGLAGGLEWRHMPEPQAGFDLARYQRHIQAHLGAMPTPLSGIRTLQGDPRRDLIWRFVAVIFMTHQGLIDIWQQGQDIMVMRRETDREGQSVS